MSRFACGGSTSSNPLSPGSSPVIVARVRQLANQVTPPPLPPPAARLSIRHSHNQHNGQMVLRRIEEDENMASSSSTNSVSGSGPSPGAPWRSLFVEHMKNMSPPQFSLSTIRRIRETTTGDSGGGSVVNLCPRTRTCVYRGLWTELPVNPKNEAELNPSGLYSSDLPVFTTDVRMDKMTELFGLEVLSEDEASHHNSTGMAADNRGGGRGGGGGGLRDPRTLGCGGGASVEATWWAATPSVQWRIRGRAYVLGPDVEDSEAGATVIAMLRARMRRAGGGRQQLAASKEVWSFKREITAHFGNLSPGMRGSFKNPPPGRSIALPVGDDRLGFGQKVTDLEDEVARRNFRVVVIVPDEVDQCDLSDPERGRRWLYRFIGDNNRGSRQLHSSSSSIHGGQVEGEWEKIEVWP